jgi:hypothetical protein
VNDAPIFGIISPLIPAGDDLGATVIFYEQKLGFTTIYREEAMAIVKRGQAELLLVKNDDKHLADNTSLRIAIEGVEQLYADYQSKGIRMNTLEVKPWGSKEFSVIDPAGVCIAFYEDVT